MDSQQIEAMAAGMSEEIKRQNVVLHAYVRRIDALEAELSRVRAAHRSIMNEILYGGTDLNDEPDIDRIHDFAMIGLKDMMSDEQ